MKQITRLQLASDEIKVADINLALELNTCGRGFITANTTTDYTGQVVRLDVGYPDLLLRWFTGYVERSQPAENGSVRLFVREMAGVLEGDLPCSLQHPTLRQIAAWLYEHTGLTIVLPDGVSYTDTAVPYFTHSGSGHQLLAELGRVFSISDYIWCPLPDGSIYIGEAGKMMLSIAVDIPSEFSQQTANGRTITIPVVQSIRPGVIVNGQRITHVRLHNQTMDLTWTQISATTGQPLQKSPVRRQIEQIYPELTSGLHLPKFARVQAAAENAESGNISDPFRPRYAVDLQLLDADGNPAKDTPVYPAIPLPTPMGGSDAGMFSYPPAGTVVEVGFAEGRQDRPFIRQTMPQGNSLPDIKPGEQLQQQRAEVSQRVTTAGDWVRQTDQAINESSASRIVTADSEQRTITERATTVKANDTATVVGKATLMAGAIQHVTTGDYSVGAAGSSVVSIGADKSEKITGNSTATVGSSLSVKVSGDISESSGGTRSSTAETTQKIIAPTVWLGSQEVNVTQLMTDTLSLLQQLVNVLATHTHPAPDGNTDSPIQASDITEVATQAQALADKYAPVIAH